MHATLVRRTSPIFPWSSVVTSASVMGLHGARSSYCQPSNPLHISPLAFADIQDSYLPVGAADSVGRPAALNCDGREISKLPK